jgi:hypothetical protein
MLKGLRILVAALPLFVDLQSPRVALADPIGLATGMIVCVGPTVDGCPPGQGDDMRDVDQISPYSRAPFILSGAFDTPVMDVTFSGASVAGFDSYGARVTASFVGVGSPFTHVAFGAGSLEHMIFNHPDYTGSRGTFQFPYTLAGTMSASGRAVGQVYLRTCIGPAGSIPLVGNPNDVPGVNCDLGLFDSPRTFYETRPLPFFYGAPFDLRVDFLTFARFFAGTGVGMVSVDYFDTATLSGIAVFAPDGTAVSGGLFIAESGTSYSTSAVVPEPGTLLLFTGGLIGAGARRWRNHRRGKTNYM